MAKRSAGILVYRRTPELEVLLVHPGGPYWSRRDDGFWTIPKGGYEEGEAAEATALRELAEETGLTLEDPELIDLGEITQRGGKVVSAWAAESDFDLEQFQSINFEMEWPPRSGRIQEFPEVDRAGWFTLSIAAVKILPSQLPYLERLQQKLEA